MKPLLFAVLLASPVFAASFTFDSDAQGWTGVNLVEFPPSGGETGIGTGAVPMAWQGSGGNPGGNVSIVDPDDGVYYFNAPAGVLGNQLATYGTTLSYDIRLHANDYHGQPDVVLMGNGLTLVASTGVDALTAGVWNGASILLNESAGWHVASLGGAVPTAGEFQDVLANLTALRIRGEYFAGGAGVETTGLDNVNFAAVPEPSSYAIAGAGLMTVLALVRRARS